MSHGTVSPFENAVYRQGDHLPRAFGVGTNHSYEMFLVGDAVTYSEADLVLADGGQVHYTRISPGTTFTGAVFEHTGTQSAFYRSRIAWNGDGWDLTMKDGTGMTFGASTFTTSERRGGVTEMRDRNGNKITITRVRDTGHPEGDLAERAVDRTIRRAWWCRLTRIGGTAWESATLAARPSIG